MERGEFPLKTFLNMAFMDGISVRVKQADRNRSYPLLLEISSGVPDFIQVQGLSDLTLGGYPFRNAKTQASRNQRFGALDAQIVKVIPYFIACLQDITETSGSHEPCRRSFSLDECVCDQSCPVDDGVEIRNGDF